MPTPRVQSLEVSLNLLSDRLKTTSHLITRLSNLKFQPGSTPAGDDSSTVLRELTAEIHDGLKRTDDDLEVLRQEVQESGLGYSSTAGRRDSERDKEQARLSVQIARLGEDYKQYVEFLLQPQITFLYL
jgi:protein transport protein SEC20